MLTRDGQVGDAYGGDEVREHPDEKQHSEGHCEACQAGERRPQRERGEHSAFGAEPVGDETSGHLAHCESDE